MIDLERINCLDIFCGSGSLGLECISRGAAMCYFVDRDTKLVSENIEKLKAENSCSVFKSDALAFLREHKVGEFRLVFCDPPFRYEFHNELLETISSMNTLLILEHPGKFIPDNKFENFIVLRKKIGVVNFTIFDFKNKPA